MVAFNLSTAAGLAELEAHLTSRSYISGCACGPVLLRCGVELCSRCEPPMHHSLAHASAAGAACPSAGCARSARQPPPLTPSLLQLRRLSRRPGRLRGPLFAALGAAQRALVQARDGAAGIQVRRTWNIAVPASASASPFRSLRARLSFAGKAEGVSVGAASSAAAAAGEDEGMDYGDDESEEELDLFGDETEEEKAAMAAKAEVIATAKARGAEKAKLSKSMIILDVKPWDDETDMSKLEAHVRSIVKDGLLWGSAALVPIGFGIKKLQITCAAPPLACRRCALTPPSQLHYRGLQGALLRRDHRGGGAQPNSPLFAH